MQNAKAGVKKRSTADEKIIAGQIGRSAQGGQTFFCRIQLLLCNATHCA
jgi:hypothetical protein